MCGLFLETKDECNGAETLQHVTTFIADLCVSGLTAEQGHYLILHEALRFFEMVRTLKYEKTLFSFTKEKPVQYNRIYLPGRSSENF
jgi:hypothetical protein